MIGDECFCAYWCQAQRGWKHNIGQGGSFHFDNINKGAVALCQRMSKLLKFHWMSYDLFVLPNNEVKMVEFSCNFGTKGAEAGGYDVRGAIIEYVIKYLKKHIKIK